VAELADAEVKLAERVARITNQRVGFYRYSVCAGSTPAPHTFFYKTNSQKMELTSYQNVPPDEIARHIKGKIVVPHMAFTSAMMSAFLGGW